MFMVYDFSMVCILDVVNIDVILVGDFVFNVMVGYEIMFFIMLDQMIYYVGFVVRVVDWVLVVVDLFFGIYQGNSKLVFELIIWIMKEVGVYVVKLEGGVEIVESIKCILSVGVLVMGYLGFILQLIYKFGIYIVWVKEEEEVDKFIEDVKLFEELGCFVIVLEKILVYLIK